MAIETAKPSPPGVYNRKVTYEFGLHWRFLWLITASLIAGVMNAMAGGGSFLSFPAMLGMGIPPIEANATNTVALWPGQLTSLATLRGDVRRSLLPVVLATAVAGSVLGAEVLLHTRQGTFLQLLPWLLLFAALVFWASGPVSQWLRQRAHRAAGHHGDRSAERPINLPVLFVAMLPIAFYIGYFGAGGGFLVMTVLALLGMEDMHQLNAMKVVTAATSNVTAIVIFIFSRRVIWHDCLVAMIFAGIGGYIGARYAKRMNPSLLRAVVVVTGLAISAYFFWRKH